MAKQQAIEIPVKLGYAEIKRQLKQIEDEIANSFDPEKIAQLSGRAKQLNKELDKTNEELGQISKNFEDIYGDMKPLTGRIGELEDQLYELALQGKQDTEEFRRLTAETIKYKNVIIETDKAIDGYTDNKGFSFVAAGLGSVGDALINLDFSTAQRESQTLNERINAITPEKVSEQMNALTGTFSNLGKIAGQSIIGMIKNVGMLAKAFLSFGLSLLSNPIFLMATAIIAIVTAIGVLLNKLGVLKPVLDAIGKVFEWIGWVIDKIVEGFNMLTDWLGFTNIAAEESARKQTEAAEKKADAYDKSSKKIISALEEEIKINQINGKSTFELELKKQEVIRKGAQFRLEALRAKLKEAKLTGELDAEELKALREKIAAQRELYQQSLSDTRVLRAQENADRRKALDEEKKEREANAKEAAANAKKYAADRLAAQRQVIDLELEAMEAGIEKELKVNAEKYRRLIEDTVRNENLVASEKARIKKLLEEQAIAEEERIKTEEQKRRQEKSAAEVAELNAALDEASKARVEAAKREAMALAELRAKQNADDLNAQIAFLEAKKNAELEDKKLTESEKALIEEQFRQDKEALEAEYRERKKELDKQAQEAVFEIAQTGANALNGLNDLVFEMKKSKLEKGSAAEEKAAKRNFDINKKIQIGMAKIAGIQGVINALTAPSTIPEPFGTILKAANAVSIGISTAANIAKIKNTEYSGAGSSPSAGGAGGTAQNATQAAAPQFNLTGNSNNFNNTSQGQAVEKPATPEITVKAVVAADEITAEQEVANSILAGSKL